MKADYIIRVGEPLKLSLLIAEGDITDVSSVQAVLKLAGPNMSVPPMSTPAVATFEVTEAELPDNGWNLYIDELITVNLKPGIYVTNARLNLVDGDPLKTDPVFIDIKPSVT
jgi:hypothetical protein